MQIVKIIFDQYGEQADQNCFGMSLMFDQALDFNMPLDKIRQNLQQNQEKFFKLPL